MSITNFMRETLNNISDQAIFFTVIGVCILEPIVAPIAVATGMLMCYLKTPNFLDENDILRLQREEYIYSIDEDIKTELENSTDSNDEVIYDNEDKTLITEEPSLNDDKSIFHTINEVDEATNEVDEEEKKNQ